MSMSYILPFCILDINISYWLVELGHVYKNCSLKSSHKHNRNKAANKVGYLYKYRFHCDKTKFLSMGSIHSWYTNEYQNKKK